jgi:hypothetical protein
LWIENESEKFAQAVMEAMAGPERDRIARNARKYVETHHRWSTLLKEIDRYLEALDPARPVSGTVSLRGGQCLELSAPCQS